MTLSKAITGLETSSLVKRTKNSKDTRSTCISLTNKARNLIPELLKAVEGVDNEIFSIKSIDDKLFFTRIITELNKKK